MADADVDSDEEAWEYAQQVAIENRKKRDAAASKAASGVVSTTAVLDDTDLNSATT
jgi:hypothetical protein